MGELFRELSQHLSQLIRGEIALVRLEIRNAIAQIGTAMAMFAVAGLLALCGILFFLMMLHSLFVQLVGPWLGELIVMLLLFLIAGVIAWLGTRRLDRWNSSGVQPHQTEGAETPGSEPSRSEESSK